MFGYNFTTFRLAIVKLLKSMEFLVVLVKHKLLLAKIAGNIVETRLKTKKQTKKSFQLTYLYLIKNFILLKKVFNTFSILFYFYIKKWTQILLFALENPFLIFNIFSIKNSECQKA